MAHLCVPQNQALGVCRGFVPDIQICGTHGRKNLVNATIISNAEEELIKTIYVTYVLIETNWLISYLSEMVWQIEQYLNVFILSNNFFYFVKQ